MNEVLFQKLRMIGVDISDSLQRFSNNEDLYLQYLHKFAEDTTINVLSDAIKNKDNETALKAAHTLKGITGNLGITVLYNYSSSMTNSFKAGKPEDAYSLFSTFTRYFSSFVNILNS